MKRKWVIIIILVLILLTLLFYKRKEVKEYVKMKLWDIHTEKHLETLHPSIKDDVRSFINSAEKQHGIKLRITSGLRTIKEQNELYNQGRTTKGKIVTNAKGGDSYHNYGLAFDVVEIKDGKALFENPNWTKIGSIGKTFGFEWGGEWESLKDKPHFQKTFGHNLSSLKVKYQKGERNGEYINLT